MNAKPGTRETKAGARERVVRTALRLFYDQGYTATGINQIIQEAGVAKASLYQLFRSKEDLLLEYLHQRCREWMDEFNQFRATVPEGRKSLLALFDYRISLIKEHRYKGCGLMRIAYELPDLEGPAAAIVREFKCNVKAIVTAGVKAYNPSLSRQESADLTETIFNFYEGSGAQAYLQRSVKPVEDAKRIIQKFIS